MEKKQITKNFLIFLIVILSIICFANALEVGGGIGIDITVVQNASDIPEQNQTGNNLTNSNENTNNNSHSSTKDNSDDKINLNFESETEQEIAMQSLSSIKLKHENTASKNPVGFLLAMTNLLLLIILLLLYSNNSFTKEK